MHTALKACIVKIVPTPLLIFSQPEETRRDGALFVMNGLKLFDDRKRTGI